MINKALLLNDISHVYIWRQLRCVAHVYRVLQVIKVSYIQITVPEKFSAVLGCIVSVMVLLFLAAFPKEISAGGQLLL